MSYDDTNGLLDHMKFSPDLTNSYNKAKYGRKSGTRHDLYEMAKPHITSFKSCLNTLSQKGIATVEECFADLMIEVRTDQSLVSIRDEIHERAAYDMADFANWGNTLAKLQSKIGTVKKSVEGHLQKFRKCLSKLDKEDMNKLKTCVQMLIKELSHDKVLQRQLIEIVQERLTRL